MSIGMPIKVLHEAEGQIVTCETNTGEVYRGKLIEVYRGKFVEAEDNMNCQMANITVTYRDGRVAQLENVYIRGRKIRFLILPDMLKNAPMFKKTGSKGGQSAILRTQAAALAEPIHHSTTSCKECSSVISDDDPVLERPVLPCREPVRPRYDSSDRNCDSELGINIEDTSWFVRTNFSGGVHRVMELFLSLIALLLVLVLLGSAVDLVYEVWKGKNNYLRMPLVFIVITLLASMWLHYRYNVRV